jgi:hypothetical protein
MAARDEDYVTLVRQANRDLWEAWLVLKGLQNEWNAQDYGNTLDLDVSGDNGHLDATKVGAVVFDTANAIDTAVMQIGHSTNVTNLL